MNIRQRKLWLLAVMAIAAIVIITLVAAPNNNKLNSGSTYGRNADGYGAWYEYMLSRGTPLQRWQKPFSKFIDKKNANSVTYIQIASKLQFKQSKLISPQLTSAETDWIRKGNTLAIIGISQPTTAAPFHSLLSQGDRQIKIATTRRKKSSSQTILGDGFGEVVWLEKIGKGKVIYAVTPHLGANAYQEETNNYEFLAELVSENKQIWVDEYIHGYKDRETITQEKKADLLNYLATTPLFPLFIQLLIMIVIAVIANFRRFGQPKIINNSVVDNSMAYIEALSGVLAKANCTGFVVSTIVKDEQIKLQKNLGLGQILVEEETLITAWTQQTEKSATKLRKLLQISKQDRPLSDRELAIWVQEWQEILSVNSKQLSYSKYNV